MTCLRRRSSTNYGPETKDSGSSSSGSSTRLTLARAHAVSGDPAAIAGYLGTGRVFDEAMGVFALEYAAQNLADYGYQYVQIDDTLSTVISTMLFHGVDLAAVLDGDLAAVRPAIHDR